nr:MAG TPA: hypothetical protein [Caudoviricetes sp.]
MGGGEDVVDLTKLQNPRVLVKPPTCNYLRFLLDATDTEEPRTV